MNDSDRHVLAALRGLSSGVSVVELAYQMRRHRRPIPTDLVASLHRLEHAGLATRQTVIHEAWTAAGDRPGALA